MKIRHLIVGMFGTNCYLFISDNELAIIDPGGGAQTILKEVEEKGIEAKYIINTHYHLDHTSANEKIKEETGAQVLIHEFEKGFVNFGVDRFLKDGDEIIIGKSVLKVFHTPGHTKGSICLLGEKFIFSGDTLFKDGYGRTDLPGGSQKELEDSLEKLSKLLKPGTIVYSGHGEIFEIQSRTNKVLG